MASFPTRILSTSSDTTDKFWGDDPYVLFKIDRLVEFFPTADMNLPERMNAITRLVLYVAIGLALYENRTIPLHFGTFVLVLIYCMWKVQTIYEPPTKNFEHFADETPLDVEEVPCTLPTKQNPFMNVLIGDDVNRPPACKSAGVSEMAENYLNEQLYNNVEDLYNRASMQRQFVTMPNTQIPNDRSKYMNWLFKDELNCKAGGQCEPYSDLRFSRRGPQSDPLVGIPDDVNTKQS